MPASLSNFVNSAEFLWVQVELAIWLYVCRVALLRLPWISFRRVFKWQPIFTTAKFMSCNLDVFYDITPLSGEPAIYGNPDLVVSDQDGLFSTLYTRSANGYVATCSFRKRERVFLLDKGNMIRDYFKAVNLINEGYDYALP